MTTIVELESLNKRLAVTDERLKEELDVLLEKIKAKEDFGVVTISEEHKAPSASGLKRKRKADKESPKKKTKLSTGVAFDDDTDDSDEEYDEMPQQGDDDDEDERRGITYQMERNKGLQVKKNLKKKELRNPRVKHRTKFRKATIRRKGQVRDYKVPKHAYDGEISGIRAGLIHSRKMK